MKPIKCELCKKFYDADKYDVCPHCASEVSTISKKSETIKEMPKEEKPISVRKGLFSKLNKGINQKKSEDTYDVYEIEKDNDFFNIGIPQKDNSSEKTVKEKENNFEEISMEPVQEKVVSQKVISENKYADIPEEKEDDTSATGIAEAIKQADSTGAAKDGKTIAYYNFSNDIDPVVGWLVCIKGEYKGESFKLKSGRNNIGRSLTMDIALAQEKSVSRERHAAVTFDPQQNKFFVQSGDSRGLTYVNQELLMSFKELKKGDIIAVSSCELMFYPLCGEDFSWDNYE